MRHRNSPIFCIAATVLKKLLDIDKLGQLIATNGVSWWYFAAERAKESAISGSIQMSGSLRKVTAAAIALSLVAVPTGAIASSPAAARATPAATAVPTNPWLTLSAMTSTSSSAATAAAAQDYDDDGPGFPPIAPLIVILGTIALAVYILTKDDGDEDLDIRPDPVSP